MKRINASCVIERKVVFVNGYKWFLGALAIMALALYSTNWIYNFYVSDIPMHQEMHLFWALTILVAIIMILGTAIVPRRFEWPM